MKRVAVIIAVGAALAASVDVIGDATQTRPDPRKPNFRTEVVFRVHTTHGLPALSGAQGLWGACQGTALRTVLPPGLVDEGNGTFRLIVRPALGRHARDRLTGCLEDTTLDRVKGKVLSMRELKPSVSEAQAGRAGQTP